MAGTSTLRQDILQAVASPCLQGNAWTSCQHMTCMLSASACVAGRTVRCNSTAVRCCLAQQQGPDLSLLSPRLKQEWDYEKNQHLGNIQIKPHSHKVLAWICPEGTTADPHCWDARVGHRTCGTGCPYCTGKKKVSKGNNLATVAPDIAKSWCYKSNAGTPQDYTSQSNHKAVWDCIKCGNQWTSKISHRVSGGTRGGQGTGCPKCYGKRQGHRKDGSRRKHPTFAECNHPLLSEWDYDRNAEEGLFLDGITLRSNNPVHWVCHQCSLGILHRWVAQPNAHTSLQGGCPFCSGQAVCNCNSLATRCPELAVEWDYSKNEAGPNDYTAASHAVVWWQTASRGSWQQRIDRRMYTWT